jgi:hypothetical protein
MSMWPALLVHVDIGQKIKYSELESQGHKWFVYWLVGERSAVCIMSDGVNYARVSDPEELHTLQNAALDLFHEDDLAIDLGCERLKVLMQRRGEWQEMI